MSANVHHRPNTPAPRSRQTEHVAMILLACQAAVLLVLALR